MGNPRAIAHEKYFIPVMAEQLTPSQAPYLDVFLEEVPLSYWNYSPSARNGEGGAFRNPQRHRNRF